MLQNGAAKQTTAKKQKLFQRVEDNQLYIGVTGFTEDIADDRWVVLTQEFQKGDWHGH